MGMWKSAFGVFVHRVRGMRLTIRILSRLDGLVLVIQNLQ